MIPIREYVIKTDFLNYLDYRFPTFVKGDHGTNILKFESIQDLTGLTVRVAFKVPTGGPYLWDAIVDGTGFIATLTIPSGVLGEEGQVDCQVALYDGSDRLTHWVKFFFYVEEDISEQAIEASDKVPILTELIETVEDLEDEVTANEAVRQANEVTREANETVRIDNEADRILAENTRESNEATRQANEAQRILNDADRMLKSTYDPDEIEADVFDMANMKEAADALILTQAERDALADLSDPAQYSTPASFLASLYNFPTGTRKAPLMAMFEGVTLRRELENNQFQDGVIHWSPFACTLSINVDGNLVGTGTGISEFLVIDSSSISDIEYTPGDLVFIMAVFKSSGASITNSQIELKGRTSGTYSIGSRVPTPNVFEEYFGIADTTMISGGMYVRMVNVFPDPASELGETLEADSDVGFVAINMTRGGIADFSADSMRDIAYRLVEGTDFQDAIVDIKTRNKNLFEGGEKLIGAGLNSESWYNPVTLQPANSFTDGYPILIKRETDHHVDGDLSQGSDIQLLSKDASILVRPGGTFYSYNYAVVYLRVKTNADGEFQLDNFLLAYGLVFGKYSPSIENSFKPYPQLPLRSLPGGKDALYNYALDPDDPNIPLTLGKWIHEKVISDEYALETGDIPSIANGTNVQYVFVNKPLDFIAYDSFLTFSGPGVQPIIDSLNSGISPFPYDDAQNIGKIAIGISLDKYAYIVPLGTYPDLASAQAAYVGTTGRYQFKIPVISELDLDEVWSFTDGDLIQNQIPCEITYSVTKNYQAFIDATASAVERLDDLVAKLSDEVAMLIAAP